MDRIEHYDRDGFAASFSNKDFAPSPGLLQQNYQQCIPVPSSSPFFNPPNETQQPSQQQWNDMRRVLQRMYIDEGKSLENVIHLLRYQQGLKVTKKQLTRRLKLWGMRKNMKLNERVVIVHNYTGTTQNMTSDPLDVKVSRAKLERWQKEMKNLKFSQDTLRESDEGTMTLCSDEPTLHAGVTHQDVESIVEDTGKSGADPDQATLVESARESKDTQGATSRDDWPFSSASIEVIGSPKLSRLFAVLKSECSEEIPMFWLDKTYKPDSRQLESPYISKDELERLSYRSESGGDRPDDRQDLQTSVVSRSIIRNSSNPNNEANPLKYPHLDFLLSHRDDEILLSPSPLNELYVFPAQYSQRYDSNPAITSLTSSELSDVLSWDEKKSWDLLCHEQDPDIIYAMEEQAYSCWGERNLSEAEYWFRRVLGARKGTEGGNTAKILSTALDIINVVQESGNIMAARKWHKKIHHTISSHFPPTNGLVLKSLQVREVNFSLNEESDEEESLSREILQAILLSFGPKHRKTLGQLECFATAMLDQRRYAEAEKLLMVTLQLSRNVPKVDFHTIDAIMSKLADALLLNGQVEPALEWCIYRAELASACLGEDDPTALGTRRKLADCLRAVGRIEESEHIFHETIRSMIRVLGERHQNTLRCMFHYGRSLSSQGKDLEAEMWLRKSFEGLLRSLGPEHRSTLYSCEWLVSCLKQQGRFDEALQLCERYLQEFATREGITDQHKHVIEVRDWMDTISKRIEEQLRKLDIFVAEEQ